MAPTITPIAPNGLNNIKVKAGSLSNAEFHPNISNLNILDNDIAII